LSIALGVRPRQRAFVIARVAHLDLKNLHHDPLTILLTHYPPPPHPTISPPPDIVPPSLPYRPPFLDQARPRHPPLRYVHESMRFKIYNFHQSHRKRLQLRALPSGPMVLRARLMSGMLCSALNPDDSSLPTRLSHPRLLRAQNWLSRLALFLTLV
jgi:hypothetical protein